MNVIRRKNSMIISGYEESKVEQYESNWSPWVYMKLNWGQLLGNRLVLLLTINFGKHHIKVLGRDVKFGLRGGQLKLVPIKALIPYKYRWPKSELTAGIKVKRSVNQESSSTQKDSGGFDATVDLQDTKTSIDISNKKDNETQEKRSVQDEFEHVIWQIYTQGSEDEVYWSFEVSSGDSCLQGSLIEQVLCKLVLATNFCAVQSKFEVFARDILPLRGFGWPWPENLSDSKQFVIQSILRKIFVSKIGLVAHESHIVYRK